MERLKLLDIILLPKRFYEGISSRLWTLYIGIILVGINDLFVTLYVSFDKLFSGKSVSVILQNAGISLISIIIIGAIDVICFAKPLSDIFKRLGTTEAGASGRGITIKLMKAYVVANVLMLIINLVLLLGSLGAVDNSSAVTASADSSDLLSTLAILWICAIVTRAAGIIHKMESRNKLTAFILIYIWSLLLGEALRWIFLNVILKMLNL